MAEITLVALSDLTDAPELKVLDRSRAQQIRETFAPMAAMIEGFETRYNAVAEDAAGGVSAELIKDAKRLRLDIAKVRVATEKTRKEQKAEYLRGGQAIDGVANILKWAVTEKENALKGIEDHFEAIERDRLDELQAARAAALSEYVDDADERDLSGMADDVWVAFLDTKRQQHEDRIAAERKAEDDRIAKTKVEVAKQKAIRAENKRLKAEAEDRQRQEAIEAAERKKVEDKRLAKETAERLVLQEEIRKKQEAHEAELLAEREAREEAEAEARAERDKLHAELVARSEAERVAREEAEAQQQAELNRGDAEKVAALIEDLRNVACRYDFESKDNRAMYEAVERELNLIISRVKLEL